MKKEHRSDRTELSSVIVPVFLVVLLAIPFAIGHVFPGFRISVHPVELESATVVPPSTPDVLAITKKDTTRRVPLPEEVRGLYWTTTTAHSDRGQQLLAYMKAAGINAVVIDLKTDAGDIVMTDPDVLEWLADEGIYRIARLPVMRDGAYARAHPEVALKVAGGELWRDNIGSLWLDPAAEQVWEDAVALAREAYAIGYDEIQFDYVRFPSDGLLSSIQYPVYNGIESKADVMARFFKHVGGTLKEEGVPISFDLFGMTFWGFEDFRIGQRLVDVLHYADFVSPMVYPSHYPDWFEGFANPAEYPYEIVKMSLDEGTKMMHGFFAGSDEELRARWRPWIQDFDIGAVYTAEMIEAQIKASRDAGASGWILWNARNVYEPANYR